MKKPLKEQLKRIGGKHLLKEVKAVVGFSKEMGKLYISKRGQAGGKTIELDTKDIEQIIKMYKKHRRDLD
jgi:hypothetical protein